MSTVTIDYTNWRGERRIREIVPLGNVRKADLDHAYHPGKWILDAMCADTGALRHFALEDIHGWREMPAADAVKAGAEGAESILARLRENGWMVAVHNDYRVGGSFGTFWLLTHQGGLYVKGEAPTDADALAHCEQQARKLFQPSP